VDAQKADVWSLGVTFVYMLQGHHPWPSDPSAMRSAIVHGSFSLERHIHRSLNHLIHKMLTVDPEARWTVEQLRRHPFFLANDESRPIAGSNSMTPKLPSLLHPGRSMTGNALLLRPRPMMAARGPIPRDARVAPH
jgi:serine/threonine protein kinase